MPLGGLIPQGEKTPFKKIWGARRTWAGLVQPIWKAVRGEGLWGGGGSSGTVHERKNRESRIQKICFPEPRKWTSKMLFLMTCSCTRNSEERKIALLSIDASNHHGTKNWIYSKFDLDQKSR